MVLVDERGGSAGIEGAKRRLSALRARGVEAELTHLDYGDYAFAGNGPNGSSPLIGIELKTTRDILNSLRSNRLIGHQVPGMVGADGKPGMYDRSWLVTEGIWREGANGAFEAYMGSWQTFSAGSKTLQMQDIESWILSTVQAGGMSYWHAPLGADTARFIRNLHHWWCDKQYEEHRSHEVIYRPPPDRAMFSTPSAFVVMVSAIPKVGWTRAKDIETAVDGNFERLMALSVKELQSIKGVGKGIAEIIYSTLHTRTAP